MIKFGSERTFLRFLLNYLKLFFTKEDFMANRFKYKVRLYYGIAHPIMNFEYHCFGYKKAGNEWNTEHTSTEYTYNEYSDSVTAERKFTTYKWAYFVRHEEYPKNALLILLEILMRIVSFVRVQFAKWAILLAVIATAACDDASFSSTILGYVGLVYLVSFIIPILGLVVRKAFKLDEKMDDLCDENGWQRWSDYTDNDRCF